MKFTFPAIAAIALAGFFVQANAQSTSPENHPRMRVKNWAARTLLFNPDIFKNDTAEILRQISRQELDSVIIYAHMTRWPEPMMYRPSKNMSDSTSEAFKNYYAKLNRLRMYKIADYEHFWNDRSWGRVVLLAIPYAANRDWDSTARWRTVYFMLPASAVEEMH